MGVLMRAEAAARLLARSLAVAGLLLLMGLAVATLLDGLLRFFFSRPIDAVRDVNGVIVAVAAAACFPLAMIERTNITIRFLTVFVGSSAGRIADIGAAKANYEAVYSHTALAAIAAGVVMFLLSPVLKKLMHGEN